MKVICICSSKFYGGILLAGKIYEVVEKSKNTYIIITDNNEKIFCPIYIFKPYYREKNLEKLGI